MFAEIYVRMYVEMVFYDHAIYRGYANGGETGACDISFSITL